MMVTKLNKLNVELGDIVSVVELIRDSVISSESVNENGMMRHEYDKV